MAEHAGKGEKVRREVLGAPHVDRAQAAATSFDTPFQDFITECAWGTVWAEGHWSLRERSIVTLALLAAGGHWDEFSMHVRATGRTSASAADIREVLMHIAVYAGVPAANRGFAIARKVLGEMGVDLDALPPREAPACTVSDSTDPDPHKEAR